MRIVGGQVSDHPLKVVRPWNEGAIVCEHTHIIDGSSAVEPDVFIPGEFPTA
jgi:hypothetical protein